MRKNNFCLLLCCFLSFSLAAQQDTVRLRNQGSKTTIITDRPPQAVYFQLLGSGPILSVKYDRRFRKRVNGAGFATGIGFWGESDIKIFSVPVQVNYLFGKANHFMEVAGGTTYVSAAESFFDSDESGFIHHLNVGYRHQPTQGGFFFRGGYSPLFYSSETITSFYLCFGLNF